MSEGKFPEKVVVTLFEDRSCEMASLCVDDVTVFNGNYWDFHDGCWNLEGDKYLGFIHDKAWRGRWNLRDALVANLKGKGLIVEVHNKNYDARA